jgi:hypothetical protein
MNVTTHDSVVVKLSSLKPHPRNYRNHPKEQLQHIITSIETYGIYRNIVVAEDDTILAGHGVVEAAQEMGMKEVPVIRLPIARDDPKALKLIASDNEISNLAIVDDRALTELLREVAQLDDDGLAGSGFDEDQLAALAMVTRPKHEIPDEDAAKEWLSMPEYDYAAGAPTKIIMSFDSEADRQDFAKRLGIQITERTKSLWWPPKAKEDPSSLRFLG